MSDPIVEAIKALHVKTVWTFSVYNEAKDDFGVQPPYDEVKREGCRECGGRTMNDTFWPCHTAAIIQGVESNV